MSRGVMDSPIKETPIAIIDFETTGLAPGPDRIVEVSVVRANPGENPRLTFDTLVDPQRQMAATEIHGITDRDVEDAPQFSEIGGDFVRAISGCVVASYNVYFDIGFLRYELLRMGVHAEPPHICLMYMRPLLDLGKRCSLSEACFLSGIPIEAAHQASEDAMASAQLWMKYQDAFDIQHLIKFQELAEKKTYKFLQSLQQDPLEALAVAGIPPSGRRKSRATTRAGAAPAERWDPQASAQDAIHRYWSEFTSVLTDLDVSSEELKRMQELRKQLGLTEEAIRGAHAKAFADLLIQSMEDQAIDGAEQQRIKDLHQCLARLGWAPGQ